MKFLAQLWTLYFISERGFFCVFFHILRSLVLLVVTVGGLIAAAVFGLNYLFSDPTFKIMVFQFFQVAFVVVLLFMIFKGMINTLFK